MLENQKNLLKLALKIGPAFTTLTDEELDQVRHLERVDVLTLNDLIAYYFKDSLTSNYTFKITSGLDDDGVRVYTLTPVKNGVEMIDEVSRTEYDLYGSYGLGCFITDTINFNNTLLEFIELDKISAAALKDRLEFSRALNTLTDCLSRLKALYDKANALFDEDFSIRQNTTDGQLALDYIKEIPALDDFKKVKLFTLDSFKQWLKSLNSSISIKGAFKLVKGLDKGSGYYLYRDYGSYNNSIEIGAVELTAGGLSRLINSVNCEVALNYKYFSPVNPSYSINLNHDLETFKAALSGYIYNQYIKYISDKETAKGVK